MTEELLQKYKKLKQLLQSYETVAVAYSSGVDSTFLLYAAKDALGERVCAITASSGSFPKRELQESQAYCQELGIKQIVCITNELAVPGFAENPPDRCYICKKALFTQMLETAKREGMCVLAEGSNLDDEGDYRPGHRAIKELGIKSPLREIGFTKKEIRTMSKSLQIPTWDKPSFACLSSRFPYGEVITKEKLTMVDLAEQQLLDMGFHQFRVRMHGTMARIELLPEEFPRIMDEQIRTQICAYQKSLGFTYTALDLQGYRSGSMNETL